MKKLVVILSFFLGISVLPLKAQDDETESAVVFLTRDKAGNEIIEMFSKIESPYLQDPRSPRFLLIDKKRQYSLGIGGYVKFRTGGDFNGTTDKLNFITNDIPVPNRKATNGQYFMDASDSRIFIELVGKNRVMGEFSAHIETDFRGPNYTLRLRQAYISMRGFLLGQAWSTFTDLAALPPTIDSEGPCGNTALRNVQIRYTHNFSKHWQAAVAAEAPEISSDYNSNSQRIYQRMPDFPMYIQYSWGKKSHIRATGVLRGMSYQDNLNDKIRTQFGWGVQISGIMNLSSKLLLYYQGTYGKGIAEYIDDIEASQLDLVPNNSKPGNMQALPMYGVYGGLQYNFTKKLYVSATYSQVRIYSENGYNISSGYHYAQYAVGNMFYNLTSNCILGLEYIWGRRANIDGLSGHANRIQAMVQYNF